ncbi:MAG: hypothetical protein IT553_07210 [Sphingomonadaceae bacterium]|nr:hypothetical protein [Sphingomonadaceae bacterium]
MEESSGFRRLRAALDALEGEVAATETRLSGPDSLTERHKNLRRAVGSVIDDIDRLLEQPHG